MDKGTLITPARDADGGESHLSKLAHPSKTSTKDETQEANTYPGYKPSAQTKCDSTASCHASSHDIEEDPATGVKCKVTPAKTVTETSNTNSVSKHFSDGADTSEPKKSAKKAKVVKKGIAQVVKRKQKKGGWEYVE